jgi:hypothetical protein
MVAEGRTLDEALRGRLLGARAFLVRLYAAPRVDDELDAIDALTADANAGACRG